MVLFSQTVFSQSNHTSIIPNAQKQGFHFDEFIRTNLLPKAQPPRSSVGGFRHPRCTAQVTATTSLRLGHGHTTGSRACTPASTGVAHSASQPLPKKTSHCGPPNARPPKTPRPGLISHPIIAIKTAPPVKCKGDSARTQAPGPTGDSGGRSVSAPPVAQPREYVRASSPARPGSVGRGPGRQRLRAAEPTWATGT